MSIFLSACNIIFLSIYLTICPSIFPFIYLSIYQLIHLSIHPSRCKLRMWTHVKINSGNTRQLKQKCKHCTYSHFKHEYNSRINSQALLLISCDSATLSFRAISEKSRTECGKRKQSIAALFYTCTDKGREGVLF